MTLAPPSLDEAAMLQHLVRISQALAGQLDFQAAILAVSREMRAFVDFDHMDICLITRDGSHLLAYEVGPHTTWSSPAEHPLSTSPIRTLLTGAVGEIVTGDATTDPRFHFDGANDRPIFQIGLRSRMHVPLRVQGAVIGALSVSSRAADLYRRADATAVRHVGDLLAPYCFAIGKAEEAKAMAIVEAEARAREEGLRLGALRLTEALERERQRIGMDLHDEVLADLTRLLHAVARLRSGAADAAPDLGFVERSIRAAIEELRRIIDDARPNVLRLFGFGTAVEELLERAARGGEGAPDARLVNDVGPAADDLPEALQVALYRIVQEALNNAVAHARAGEIVVRMARDGPRLVLSVTDDGVGLARRAGRRLGGISNMRTRARLVGADFTIDQPPSGRGTRVVIRLPLPDAAGSRQTRDEAACSY